MKKLDRFLICFSIGSFSKQSMLYFPCLTFSSNYNQPTAHCYSHPQTLIIEIKWRWYISENIISYISENIFLFCPNAVVVSSFERLICTAQCWKFALLNAEMLKGRFATNFGSQWFASISFAITIHRNSEIKHKVLNRIWQHVWRHE